MRVFRIVTVFLSLIMAARSQAQNFTNKGTEFWVGYGHHQYMETSCDGLTLGDNTMNMVLYLSAEQAATVTVSIDSSGNTFPPLAAWSKTYNIPANTVIQSDIIPKGPTNASASGSDPNYDARLFSNFGGEELFRKRGIHIVSNVPIVAYAHIYGGVSSGATMLLPVDTWGYSYTSINSEQHDADRSFSWMYVVAKENNTRVRITPSATSRLGKPAGVPFTVDMQKGQIYQLIGQATCSTGNGVELTGTTVKSIVGADGVCHKIGVFSGSSRTAGESAACGSAGRDNDMQQCFPEVAWGKRYLTTPFSSASTGLQASKLQTSVYKIIVKDPATVVKKNGVIMTGLINGKYYKYNSATADYIEADKPVMMAQFMVGGGTSCGSSQGDPEMVYISPIEQAISNIGFFRNTKEAIVFNYLTLVVPTAGLSSLYVNNSQLFDYTYPHPQNTLLGTNYTVVVKGWAAAQSQVIVKCDSAFNAITYGLGGAESYGYNAGTYLKNLNAEGEIFNTPDTSNTARPFTCTGTPMQLSALIAYKPTSMNWKISSLGSVVSPNADVLVSNPAALDSVTIGIAKYYRYKLPGTYVFNTAGTYDLPIVLTSTDIDNCSLQETVQIKVEVKQRQSSSFTYNFSGCRTDSVAFTGPAALGSSNAVGWHWDFGDATTSTIKDPKKLYAATGAYNVSLFVTSTEGCLSDTTTATINILNARPASIFASPANGCVGTAVTFSDTTTLTAGTFWWDFGTGTPVTLTSNTPQTFTYATPGTYVVKHTIKPANNCLSDTVYKTITIYASPGKPAASSPLAYCQNTTAAPLTATASAGNTLTWYSAFPLTGGSPTAPTPSTTAAGTFYYYVTQTNATGCTSDTAKIQVDITPAIATNTIAADQTVCSGSPAAALTASTPTGGTGTSYSYQWQQSTDGGATWTTISGVTSPAYNPGILSTGVTQFRRVVTSGLCSSTSNVVSITVQTNLSTYDIGASQSICEGNAPALLVGQTATGGTGTITYQWQSSSGSGGPWTDIPAATTINYQPPALTVNTYYRRIATGGLCPAISSVVLITVKPTPNGSIATATTAICQYNTASVSFTATAGTAPFTVNLLVTPPGAAAPYIVTQTAATNAAITIPVIPLNSAAGTYTVALQSLSDGGACTRAAGMNSLTIVVTATPKLTFTPAAPALCAGTPVTLNASGAITYAWTPATGLSATTGATVTANPVATTKYFVTGTTNGCNGVDSVTVTVNPIPAKPVVAASSFTYCQNTAATTLSATALAGHTLTWYNAYPLTGGSAAAPTPSTATAGTFFYYVTQTAAATGCVSDTAKIQVTVTPAIAGNTVSAGQTVCAGTAAASLTGAPVTGGTNSYGYQWQSSTDGGTTWTNIAGATAPNYSPGVLLPGTTQFRRVVTSGLCSSTSNAVSITVQTSLSNYQISGAQTVCEGVTPALLDGQTPTGGTGSYSYVWDSSPDGATWTAIPGATMEDYQPPALTVSTYYRRTASGGLCPATSNPVLITVNPAPAGTITAPTGICSYQTADVTFTASAGTAPFNVQLKITAPGGATSAVTQTISSNGPVAINVLPLNSAAGTYTVALVSITDSKGCSRTTGLTSVSLLVTAKPSVALTAAAATICEGTSTTLTATGATSYAWSPATGLSAATGASVTAAPVTTTVYTVVGSTNGCTDTKTVGITVISKPAKPVVTATVDYCMKAASVPLIATATAGNTLAWYTSYPLTGGTATAPVPSTSIVTSYTYYVTQSNSNGCVSDTSVITVTVHPLPVADFTLPGGICMPAGVASFINKTTVADNANLSYAWNFGDGSGTSAVVNPAYTYAASGSYAVKLKATSSFGCADSTTKTLSSFFEKPIALFNVNPAELCQGQNNSFIDNSNPRGSTVTKWWWDFGDGTTPGSIRNPTHRYTRPGTYTVNLVVTTAIGCVSDTLPLTVVVHLQPKIDAGPSFVVPQGTSVTFQATANDTTIGLYWSPATGLSNPGSLRPTLTAIQNQTYTLTAVGDFNCTATDTLTVRILKPLEVPNAFSPNGDGINDTWLIPNLADYPGAKVEIFNRWGQQVYLSYGYNRPWDGTYLGKALPLATYYYVITLNNGFKPVAGSVTIIK